VCVELEDVEFLGLSEFLLEGLTRLKGVQQAVVEERRKLVLPHILNLRKVLQTSHYGVFKDLLVPLEDLVEALEEAQAGDLELEALDPSDESVHPIGKGLVELLALLHQEVLVVSIHIDLAMVALATFDFDEVLHRSYDGL